MYDSRTPMLIGLFAIASILVLTGCSDSGSQSADFNSPLLTSHNQDELFVPCMVLIDEDSFDQDAPAIVELFGPTTCAGGTDDDDSSDDTSSDEGTADICPTDAAPGNRTVLDIPIGTIIGNGVQGGTDAPFYMGRAGDAGWFALADAPASWIGVGPTSDGITNFFIARADGFGRNGEHLLDQISDVTPMSADDLRAMIGQTCCAVVYDGDVTASGGAAAGNLQGANLGVVSFKVLAVGPDTGGSMLPDITIMIEDPYYCFEETEIPGHDEQDPNPGGSITARGDRRTGD